MSERWASLRCFVGKPNSTGRPMRSNEYRIKKKLLRQYDRTSRPVRDDRTTVNVLVALSLSHILDTVRITTSVSIIFIN